MGLRLSQLLDLVSYNDKQIVSSLYFPRLQYISSSAADPVPWAKKKKRKGGVYRCTATTGRGYNDRIRMDGSGGGGL